MKVVPGRGALPSSAEHTDISNAESATTTGESSKTTDPSQQETSIVEKGLPSLDTVTRVGATSAAAVMVGGGVAAGAIVASQPPVDKSSFDHILIRDQPINEIPILMQHNAGNVPGSGSVPIVGENQTMDIGDVLDKISLCAVVGLCIVQAAVQGIITLSESMLTLITLSPLVVVSIYSLVRLRTL